MNSDDLKSGLLNSLHDLGITRGQTVFVQSRLISFIQAARELTPGALPEIILNCISDAVGEEGTIVMPSFTTACARKGAPFDLIHTPSDAGALAEYLRIQPGTIRSLHPVNSIIASGPLAVSLTEKTSPGSYSWDSPFDRMASQDTIVLCMGMTENLSNSFSHYAEARTNVPYLYNKKLDYIPVSIDGEPVANNFYMSVRYLDFDIQPDRSRHDQVVRESGLMRFAEWGGGQLRAIRLVDHLNIFMRQLNDDPFFLLSHPPTFRIGERPAEGPAISMKKEK